MRLDCADCGIDTLPNPRRTRAQAQWYMVHKHVWQQAGMSIELGVDSGFLCLDCIEARLGRPLDPSDLTDYPINTPGVFDDTSRLRALKEAKVRRVS